jgi:tetratricopeptide (TPR) repeat protein
MPVLAASSSPSDRSYSVAVGVILVFAALEILAIAIHFGAVYRAERVTLRSTKAPAPAASVKPGGTTTTPAPPQASAPSSAALSASDRLLKEANDLRERGDTANALARLQDASQRDPRNPQVLAETAAIYESIQLYDRSNETWKKIQDLGPSAGPLYELADMKLRVGAAATPSPGVAMDTAGKPLDAEGLPEGSVFGVTNIETEQVSDPDAETNFRLKIGIKKRDGVAIDHSKLRIMVLFYDLLDNDKVVATDADVNYEWMNPKHDWGESNPETLIVTYLRSKTHAITSEAALSAAAAAVTPGKNSSRSKKRGESAGSTDSLDSARRQYLGYVIRILYDDKLQTVRADPPRLINDAPNSSLSP